MKQVADAAFNYNSISPEKAASARAAAERIRGRLNAAFIETGRDLAIQKEALGHGNFLKWIDAEFGLGERSVRHLMSIAEFVDANRNHGADLENMSARALRELAAPSTTEPVRAAVFDRSSKGEKVTAADIEKLKKQLAEAKEEAKQAESEVLAQAKRAELAEAAHERLSDTVTDLQDEVSRLSEEGVIHVAPSAVAADDEPDDAEDVDDDVSPRAVRHRAKIAFLLRADEARRNAFFPPDQKPDRETIREAELTMESWKSLVTKLKNGEVA